MKKLYTCALLLLFKTILSAQTVDTVLYENFQFNVFTDIPTMPTGSDLTWVNFDQDGLPSILNTEATKRWHWGEFFINPTDPITGEVNYSAISYSYLLNSLPGNRNWLILPPVQVNDAGFTLSWRSSPSQLPRYMDGYQVMVSTTGNQPADFKDTLFVAASMASITGNSQSTNFSNFLFTPGYIHANSCQDSAYFVPGGTINHGLLEPHSKSLAAYSGRTIYIAFLHNSDDDDRLALDDILVKHIQVSGVQDHEMPDLSLRVDPNPVEGRAKISFNLPNSESLHCDIISSTGQKVFSRDWNFAPAGQNSIELDLTGLPSGVYFAGVSAGALRGTQLVVKK